MATCTFRSPLAHRLQAFLEIRRTFGRKGETDRKILTYLDRFLMSELKPGQTITPKIVERWIQGMDHLSVGTRINRLSLLRQFCVYLSQFDARTCLVHRSFFPRRIRPAPYIYSKQEIRSILAAARKIGPPGSLRPAVISTLIGLLAATGLRIGEALKLTLADIDLSRQLLTIREGKFNKSRYVPISLSTARHLGVFLRQRERAGFSTAASAPVFISPYGRAYGPARVCEIFLEVVRGLGLRGPKGQPGPRLHDFRHTFAVNRLTEWYRHEKNLAPKLPLLATYMGHTSVVGTEVYLRATTELLESTGQRFHSRFAIPPLMR